MGTSSLSRRVESLRASHILEQKSPANSSSINMEIDWLWHLFQLTARQSSKAILISWWLCHLFCNQHAQLSRLCPLPILVAFETQPWSFPLDWGNTPFSNLMSTNQSRDEILAISSSSFHLSTVDQKRLGIAEYPQGIFEREDLAFYK